MKTAKWMSMGAAAAMALGTLGAAAPAAARDGYHRGYDDYRPGDYYRGDRGSRGYYNHNGYRGYSGGDRGYYRDTRYHGYRGQARYRCNNDGAAGTIIGAIAGGLLGHEVVGRRGDKTAGTIIGGAVGAVAGRAIDKGDSRC